MALLWANFICLIGWCWCVSGSTGGAEVCCSSLWVPVPPRLPAQPAPVHAVSAPGPQQGSLPWLSLPPLPLPPPEQSQTQRPPLFLLQHAHQGCEGWQGRVRLHRFPRQPSQQPQHSVPLLLQQPTLLPGTMLQHFQLYHWKKKEKIFWGDTIHKMSSLFFCDFKEKDKTFLTLFKSFLNNLFPIPVLSVVCTKRVWACSQPRLANAAGGSESMQIIPLIPFSSFPSAVLNLGQYSFRSILRIVDFVSEVGIQILRCLTVQSFKCNLGRRTLNCSSFHHTERSFLWQTLCFHLSFLFWHHICVIFVRSS